MLNLRLQKVLYFIQAYYLVEENRSLFNDEFEAWDFGVVISKVFNEFKKYGALPIPCIKEYIDNSNGLWLSRKIKYNDNIIKDEDKKIINKQIGECDKYSLNELTKITINQTPWINGMKTFNKVISNKSIIEFFNWYEEEINENL